MITISLTDSIVERDEMNHHLTVEMNLVTNTIDFKSIVALKSALYVKNSNVDQSITSKRSGMTRKNDFLTVISSTKSVKNLIAD
jgi:hypothetical protein